MADAARCGGCGSIAPGDDGLCKPCRIERDEGPEARRAYLSELGKRGAKAAHERRSEAPDPADVPAAPETLEDAVGWASWAVHSVTIGLITTRQAREIANLLKTFVDAAEKRDLKSELEELRDAVAELRRKGMRAS